MKTLENEYYAPVMIYSNNASHFREERDAGIFSYPENLICEVDKGDFKDISVKVSEWLNTNTTAKLSNIYLEEVYHKIHQTFWKLNDIPHGNIASVYKNISSADGNIDWSNDFIVNLLLQNLVSDENFRTQISDLIETIQNPKTNPDEKKKILNKIIYFKSNSPYVCNGDIFKIEIGEIVSYGIVTSLDCDLFQKNTKYVDFVELRKLQDDLGSGEVRSKIKNNKSESHFYFLSLELEENSFTNSPYAIFEKVIK